MLAGFNNVTFEFGSRIIVEDATWHIHPGERIGLIGYNGTGKSTLLKLFAGEYSPSAGTVERSRSTSIGYLHQDLLSFDTNDSILNVALDAFEKIKQLEKEIEDIGKQLEANHDDKLLETYTDKLHEMDVLDGYNIHHKTEEVLQGLGFSNDDLQRPYKEFSGGWRMRVLLAKMILQQPDLLLLDEPTNHLDLPSIEWLEKYLQNYKGSVVIVSHDKYFLNRMVTKIVELYQQELHIYTGNYDYYETEKALRIEQQQRAYENQQDYIRQNERLIERFRAKASKAAMAQSLIKKLDRLDRIENAELERPNLRINFKVDVQPGKVIATLKHATKKFGDLTIIEESEAEILRGDKIALIGANGKGKSTVLRMIAGTEKFEGQREWGYNIAESFYAQHQLEALDLSHSILEEMSLCGSGKTEQELRSLLGCFLFSGDDTDKKIKVLSGGEKARVALAKVIAGKANFLLLDEPTNHLDIHSVELLIEALDKYEGSYILVSHDRYFVSRTANKIWEIDEHKLREFKGSYAEWEDWKERREAELRKDGKADKGEKLIKEAGQPKAGNVAAVTTDDGQQTTEQHQTNNDKPASGTAIDKELKKELQKQKNRFTQLEEKIALLNKTKTELEAALANPATYNDKTKFVQAETAYKNAETELSKLNAEYEVVFEKVMELEEKMG